MTASIKTITIGVVSTLLASSIAFGATYIYDAHDQYAKKDQVLSQIIDVRLHQIDESIDRYHEKGLQNLTDSERHKYNGLVEKQRTLEAKKESLDGF